MHFHRLYSMMVLLSDSSKISPSSDFGLKNCSLVRWFRDNSSRGYGALVVVPRLLEPGSMNACAHFDLSARPRSNRRSGCTGRIERTPDRSRHHDDHGGDIELLPRPSRPYLLSNWSFSIFP